MKKQILTLIVLTWLLLPLYGFTFDHQHARLDRLLRNHVTWINNGSATQVNYREIKNNLSELTAYLNSLSGVTLDEFNSWRKPEQLAFLINAYNGFTLELILTRYPDIDSIKDIGSLFKSPWKRTFFTLFGKKRHLDFIEHGMIRKPGVYDDPRIHTAVNCASVGCPALRNEAFTPDRLSDQLEDNLVRFLKDKTRNRFNAKTGLLEVSKIFHWYKTDFQKGYLGFDSLNGFFKHYAKLFSDDPAAVEQLKQRKVKIRFLDYDWRLNDIPKI